MNPWELLPSGVGWNIETLTWVQTLTLELGISYGIWWLVSRFRPMLAKLPALERRLASFLDEKCPHCGEEL